MTTTELAARVLQEIDAALALAEKATIGPWEQSYHDMETLRIYARPAVTIADIPAQRAAEYTPDSRFIAASRTGWPKTLRCLKRSIEGWQKASEVWSTTADALAASKFAITQLAELCDQWEAK